MVAPRAVVNETGVDEKFTGKELDNDNEERMFYFGARGRSDYEC